MHEVEITFHFAERDWYVQTVVQVDGIGPLFEVQGVDVEFECYGYC